MGLAVLLATGALLASPPAHGPALAQVSGLAPDVPSTIQLRQQVDDLSVSFEAEPNLPGRNKSTIQVSERRSPPSEILRVIVRFSYLGQDLGTASADAQNVFMGTSTDGSNSAWQLQGDQLSLSGLWQVDIEKLFQEPQVVAETLTQARTIESGHGRIEERCLTASTALVGYTDWPGMQQVFRPERTVTIKKTGAKRHEVVYGTPALRQAQRRRNCHQSLAATRQRRPLVAPQSPPLASRSTQWICDVTFDEDRSQVRCGHIAEVMAALRNVAIARLRLAGETNVAAARRRLAAQPWAALALIGIVPES